MQLRAFLAAIPLLAALSLPAQAQRMADGETLDRILPDIRAAHPGKLSDAQPWTDDTGRTHYRIKWMTPEGRILYFDADTRSGRYSSSDGARDAAPRTNSSDRPRGGDGDNRPAPQDGGRQRDNWNGESGPFGNEPASRGGDSRGNGDLRRNGDSRGNGDWRGGRGASDNGGERHHGHGGN